MPRQRDSRIKGPSGLRASHCTSLMVSRTFRLRVLSFAQPASGGPGRRLVEKRNRHFHRIGRKFGTSSIRIELVGQRFRAL